MIFYDENFNFKDAMRRIDETDALSSEYDKIGSNLKFKRNISLTGAIIGIVFSVICLIFTIIAIRNYFAQKSLEETKIPHHIMNATKKGMLVFYNSVKTLGGEISDINNHESIINKEDGGWLVLYTTRNPDAGTPILADSIKVVDSSNDIGKGEAVMHPFNSDGGLNTVAPLYTGKYTNQETYIVYKKESKAA